MNLYKYSLIQHNPKYSGIGQNLETGIRLEHQNSPKQTGIQTETEQGGQCIGLSTKMEYFGWNGTKFKTLIRGI